ncbi:MAG: hypothetical protein LBT44_06475 [Clostridiales bacterium]|nr:hypothetical protein [Clostridiales bacterium]
MREKFKDKCVRLWQIIQKGIKKPITIALILTLTAGCITAGLRGFVLAAPEQQGVSPLWERYGSYANGTKLRGGVLLYYTVSALRDLYANAVKANARFSPESVVDELPFETEAAKEEFLSKYAGGRWKLLDRVESTGGGNGIDYEPSVAYLVSNRGISGLEFIFLCHNNEVFQVHIDSYGTEAVVKAAVTEYEEVVPEPAAAPSETTETPTETTEEPTGETNSARVRESEEAVTEEPAGEASDVNAGLISAAPQSDEPSGSETSAPSETSASETPQPSELSGSETSAPSETSASATPQSSELSESETSAPSEISTDETPQSDETSETSEENVAAAPEVNEASVEQEAPENSNDSVADSADVVTAYSMEFTSKNIYFAAVMVQESEGAARTEATGSSESSGSSTPSGSPESSGSSEPAPSGEIQETGGEEETNAPAGELMVSVPVTVDPEGFETVSAAGLVAPSTIVTALVEIIDREQQGSGDIPFPEELREGEVWTYKDIQPINEGTPDNPVYEGNFQVTLYAGGVLYGADKKPLLASTSLTITDDLGEYYEIEDSLQNGLTYDADGNQITWGVSWDDNEFNKSADEFKKPTDASGVPMDVENALKHITYNIYLKDQYFDVEGEYKTGAATALFTPSHGTSDDAYNPHYYTKEEYSSENVVAIEWEEGEADSNGIVGLKTLKILDEAISNSYIDFVAGTNATEMDSSDPEFDKAYQNNALQINGGVYQAIIYYDSLHKDVRIVIKNFEEQANVSGSVSVDLEYYFKLNDSHLSDSAAVNKKYTSDQFFANRGGYYQFPWKEESGSLTAQIEVLLSEQIGLTSNTKESGALTTQTEVLLSEPIALTSSTDPLYIYLLDRGANELLDQKVVLQLFATDNLNDPIHNDDGDVDITIAKGTFRFDEFLPKLAPLNTDKTYILKMEGDKALGGYHPIGDIIFNVIFADADHKMPFIILNDDLATGCAVRNGKALYIYYDRLSVNVKVEKEIDEPIYPAAHGHSIFLYTLEEFEESDDKMDKPLATWVQSIRVQSNDPAQDLSTVFEGLEWGYRYKITEVNNKITDANNKITEVNPMRYEPSKDLVKDNGKIDGVTRDSDSVVFVLSSKNVLDDLTEADPLAFTFQASKKLNDDYLSGADVAIKRFQIYQLTTPTSSTSTTT